MKRIATLALCSMLTGVSYAQIGQAAQYQQAAQVYFSAAAKCQNPVGAACMMANGRYYQCLAAQLGPGGPSSCTQPTCSTACTTSSGTAGTAAGATSNNNVNNLVQLGVGIIGLFHSNNSQPDSQPAEDTGPTPEELAAQAAAAEAARQQQINNDAANILQEANSLVAANNGPASPPSPSDSTAEVSSLLDDGPASPDPAAAVSALLDTPDNGAASTTADAVAGLLDNNTISDSASAFPAPDTQGPAAMPSQSLPADLDPQDQQMDTALQDSVDQPDPSQTGSLAQMFQSSGQPINDGLNDLVTPGNTLASSVTNDPVVQWAASDQGSLTTVPLPAAGDDPDTAANKVFGQSVAGFGDLIKGMAGGPVEFAQGLYSYGTKMVDQMGADLGLANDTISGTK